MGINTNYIWEEFSEPLKRFIKQRIANEYDTEDVLHEVFIKIHNNIGSLMNDNEINAWIYRITRNTIIDYYRKKGKNLEVIELPEDLESDTHEKLLANAEIASCLKGMIDSLPEKYKQVILLTEFQEMTQKEVSEKLDISISGAKSRVQRARKMLKKRLLGCCHLEFDNRGNIIDYKHRKSECQYC